VTTAATAAERVRLGVVGWPVAHSRSPAMHNAALAAAGLTHWRYQLVPLAPELVSETLPALGRAGFRGVNVTIPHKGVALAVATDPTPRACAIGAANTLVYQHTDQIIADNTDGPALVDALAALTQTGRVSALASALVLGAGGSARAAVWALREAGVGEIAVWNRTDARAQAFATQLGVRAVRRLPAADVLVNCTAVGLVGAAGPATGETGLDDLPLGADDLADYGALVDFVYARGQTPLIAAARARDVPTIDGLELLVGQGAISFERFTGRPAPREVMRTAAADGYRDRP
jgi:shikimate dehydrogenase